MVHNYWLFIYLNSFHFYFKILIYHHFYIRFKIEIYFKFYSYFMFYLKRSHMLAGEVFFWQVILFSIINIILYYCNLYIFKMIWADRGSSFLLLDLNMIL